MNGSCESLRCPFIRRSPRARSVATAEAAQAHAAPSRRVHWLLLEWVTHGATGDPTPAVRGRPVQRPTKTCLLRATKRRTRENGYARTVASFTNARRRRPAARAAPQGPRGGRAE